MVQTHLTGHMCGKLWPLCVESKVVVASMCCRNVLDSFCEELLPVAYTRRAFAGGA